MFVSSVDALNFPTCAYGNGLLSDAATTPRSKQLKRSMYQSSKRSTRSQTFRLAREKYRRRLEKNEEGHSAIMNTEHLAHVPLSSLGNSHEMIPESSDLIRYNPCTEYYAGGKKSNSCKCYTVCAIFIL